MVEYLNTEAGEEYSAAIFGVIAHKPDDKQVRKMLVLYDVTLDKFFLGNWPVWRRVPKGSLPAGAVVDREKSEDMLTITLTQCQTMVASFPKCQLLTDMDTVRKAERQASEAPPALKLLRAVAKREAAATVAAEREVERAAAKKAARAAAAAKAGRGRGKGGGPPPPHHRPPRDPPSRELKGEKHKKRRHSTRSPSPASSSDSSSQPSPKRARRSPASSCGTPWEVVKAREELAALEAAHTARLRAKIDRHDRKKHEKKHKHHR